MNYYPAQLCIWVNKIYSFCPTDWPILQFRVSSLAIYYLDIFMDRHRIAVERLSLVVLCCLGIASKLEDRDADVPKYSDLNNQMNNVYCISDYQKLGKESTRVIL